MALLIFFASTASAEAPQIQDQSNLYDQFVEARYVPIRSVPRSVCSCVQFAKEYTGHSSESWGNAWQIKPTSDKPYIGGLVLTIEGKGHIAVIEDIQGDELFIVEANYVSCAITRRILKIGDPKIRGYK